MSSLLPARSSALERALELLAELRLADIDTPLRDLWNPQTCPEELLPWLAWALSIDSWDANWPVQVRRARVAAAIAVQRRKGTRQSVVDVVQSFGGAVRFEEWWQQEPPGDPHTFHLTVAVGGQSQAPTPLFIDQVIEEVQRTKPVRSHFDFVLAGGALGGVGLVGAARAMIFRRLGFVSQAAPTVFLLLSGDQAGGLLLLSGDQTDGDDRFGLNVYS